ncbi:Aryl-phospho-beta-D-glucosidase BglC, GH1 family [Vibrio xiamenensis]|uniref:Aryl-phospho-beta-D-glucosidase BglC, GH1 family n=1 Tax=Vibrio xiamenensis TaxID=861298 RepID=A0A1G8CHJ1_9VIBR|nr:glycoside hydrolase family 5 protein [Vibrio xiamenensis]SDH44905.1 Aryl-phospho-beta-D-glucosidase BglC, GH1 family [Vibrio xiamenensis]
MNYTNSASNLINHRDNQQTPAQIRNAAMGKGVNIDHPTLIEIGDLNTNALEQDYFQIISDAGFTNVRLALNWQTHWDPDAEKPYENFDGFAKQIIAMVAEAKRLGLYVIVDLHEFTGDLELFLAIWARIQSHFADHPEVMFEPLNEPRPGSEFTDDGSWNEYLEAFYELIRATEPERIIMAGTLNWNNADNLINLPPVVNNDEYTIVTLHQYAPETFTFQGTKDSQYDVNIGGRWSALEEQRLTVDTVINTIKINTALPVNIGEYGCNHEVLNFEQYNAAPEYSRRRWIEYNTYCYQNEGFSSCCWEFCEGFGFFDKVTKELDENIVQAILDPHDIPLVPTITENIDPVDYAILNSKFSISLTAKNADAFRLQQYNADTDSWEDVTSYLVDEKQNTDGSVTVTFQSSTIASSSWGSPSAFRILATNTATSETIESNVTVRKVVSEIPLPAIVTDLPETSTVNAGSKYHVNASFTDTQQGTVKLYQITEEGTKDVTPNYKVEEYTIDGLLHIHLTTTGPATENWASPAAFYMEATGYDGSTVRTSETTRTVITKREN